jgi:transglutaminase-like putative cysteine protease
LIYRVRHVTTYDYADPVSVSHHVLRLTPRNLARQRCSGSRIAIAPSPQSSTTRTDYFGNVLTFFTLREPHGRLRVEAGSELEVHSVDAQDFSRSLRWEMVPLSLQGHPSLEVLDAYQFVFDSERVGAKPELAAYARDSFLPGRPILEAVRDLTRRIHQDFRFDTEATEVTTPVETFFEKRRGVCQDFAHLEIACLRSLGLPARYVSGYLRTIPSPGCARLEGADASHAWCSAWSPDTGWVDFDPTNDCVPTDGHVTLAWGRDYNDVCPIHGVLLGGARHTLHVGVDVIPVES